MTDETNNEQWPLADVLNYFQQIKILLMLARDPSRYDSLDIGERFCTVVYYYRRLPPMDRIAADRLERDSKCERFIPWVDAEEAYVAVSRVIDNLQDQRDEFYESTHTKTDVTDGQAL